VKEEMKIYQNPKFKTIEEEEQYWATHSPLDEGYEREVGKGEQKLTSILTVRLTGEEITDLRDIASELGMGPSTYARMVLKMVIKEHKLSKKSVKSSKNKTAVDDKGGGYYILNEEDALRVSRIAEEVNSLKTILESSRDKINPDSKN
jgi:hypothetical protein